MTRAEEIGLKSEELKKLILVFEKKENISEAILFGSRALGTFRNGSDIDIALKGNISHKEWLDLMIEFDELDLPYKLDLIQFEKINTQELLSHIERAGITIFKRNIKSKI